MSRKIRLFNLLKFDFRSPPTNQKANLKAKSPICIKSAFGNFIPAKVEVNMAHSSSQTNNSCVKNNNSNSNSIGTTTAATTTTMSTNNNNNGSSGGDMISGGNGSGNSIGVSMNNVLHQRHASQPIDITASSNGAFVKPSAPTVAQQLAFNKMERKKANRRYDKNLTFSTPVDDPLMDEDFDFEKNLALFDKQAIWDKIDANQKPDLVRNLLHLTNFNFTHLLHVYLVTGSANWTRWQKGEKLSTR